MRNAQIEIADIVGQVDELRRALEMQMDELRAQQAVLAGELKHVQQSLAVLEAKKPAPAVVAPPPPAPKVETKPAAPDAVPEEIMLVIAAAVAAFVGRSARVRSVRYVHEGQSPWAQQGRVFVQASHNLVHHG